MGCRYYRVRDSRHSDLNFARTSKAMYSIQVKIRRSPSECCSRRKRTRKPPHDVNAISIDVIGKPSWFQSGGVELRASLFDLWKYQDRTKIGGPVLDKWWGGLDNGPRILEVPQSRLDSSRVLGVGGHERVSTGKSESPMPMLTGFTIMCPFHTTTPSTEHG
jgi:hypothetical protein